MTDWQNRIVDYKQVPANQLLANPDNARRHPPRQREALRGSLDTLGWVAPIIVNVANGGGHVLDGHARIEEALTRNETMLLPVIEVDLSPDEEKLFLASFDYITYMADYDREALDSLLQQLQADDSAMQVVIEGDERLQDMLSEMAQEHGLTFGDVPEDAGAQLDRAAELQEVWQVSTGDLWIIPSITGDGHHRLLCGDSTNADCTKLLFDGQNAKLFATDPPYGANAGTIGFTAQRDDIEAITKDDLEGVEMQAFLECVFSAWIPYLAIDTAWYLWHPMLTQGYFAAAAAAAAAADLIIHRQIIWNKSKFIFGRGDYHWRHELCFYGWRSGHRPQFYGERNQDTVWAIPYDEIRSQVGHPTAKPVELFAIPIRNHTLPHEICAEPFAGSGSQFVAGEQLSRLVYGMEISEKYCAVILQRMTDLGCTPERV